MSVVGLKLQYSYDPKSPTYAQEMKELKELKNRGYRDAIVDLNFKAIYGDKSDNIPKIGPCITKEKAIALAQLSKTELNSYLIDNNLMDNYEFNMNLISFENIPQKYIDIYNINNKIILE